MSNKIDADAVKAAARIEDVIGGYIDIKPNGKEFTGLCPFHDEKTPSFHVIPAKDMYYCFGCGAHGDSIDFVMEHTGKGFTEACKSIAGNVQLDAVDREKRASRQVDYYAPFTPQNLPANTVLPVPGEPLSYYNAKREKMSTVRPSHVWPYRSAVGEIIGIVIRFEIDGDKITPTLRWCGDKFVNYPFGESNRTLFNLDKIIANPGAQVAIVEGEKAAAHLDKLFGDNDKIIATCWAGGTKVVGRTDWGPLRDRNVLFIRDNDKPGINAMRDCYERLMEVGVQAFKAVHPEPDRPKGWDVADQEWQFGELVKWAKSRIGDIPPPPEDDTVKKLPALSEHDIPVQDVECTVDSQIEYFEAQEAVSVAAMADSGIVQWRDSTPQGKPKGTLENFQHLMAITNMTARYNLISKEIEVTVPGGRFTDDNRRNATLAHIKSHAARWDFPSANIRDYVLATADANPYNPVKDWIDTREWDGQDRIKPLADTLGADNPELAYLLLKRWLISAVVAVYSPSGVSAGGCLVLQGRQGLGKTAWFLEAVQWQSVMGQGKRDSQSSR